MIFICIDGHDARYVELDRERVTIGRRPELWICDLKSTSGTYVDGHRVPGEALLAPGAVVHIGGTKLRVYDARPPK